MPWLAVTSIIIAIFFFWLANRRRKSAGLPAGTIIYSDTNEWIPVQDALYDPILGLAGKPDYLVQDREHIIPVEVKSRPVTKSPYDSHIFQLASYCLLVENNYGVRPSAGILHYPNKTYRIDFTPRLERTTINIIDEMHAHDDRKAADRSHQSPARCSGCGFRSICDQRIK